MVAYLRLAYRVSERRACRVGPFHRSTQRYRSRADEQAALKIRLKELAATRVRYGYRRLHVLLRREGWRINHKRVYRLYKLQGLGIRTRKPRRHRAARTRVARPQPNAVNACWSMDFVSDQLFDGRQIRVLTIVDCHSRESLVIEPRIHFRAVHVVEALARLVKARGAPESIRCDNGPEFTSRVLDQWAYWNKVELDFSRPGKPTDNAFIESFNGRLRQECLNTTWFLSLADAEERLEAWRREYYVERPHTSLGILTPSEFLAQSPQPMAGRTSQKIA